MKIKHIVPFLILICSALFSCENGLYDYAYDVTVSVPVVINETTLNPGGKTYADTLILDLNSDPAVAEDANIKELKVNKVTYTISGANPSSVFFSNFKLKIVTSGKTIASTIHPISLSTTSETQFTADAAGFSELASNLLVGQREQQIQLQGNLSSTPVAFTMNVKFYLTVTSVRRFSITG